MSKPSAAHEESPWFYPLELGNSITILFRGKILADLCPPLANGNSSVGD
jgi:hypothetical protein